MRNINYWIHKEMICCDLKVMIASLSLTHLLDQFIIKLYLAASLVYLTAKPWEFERQIRAKYCCIQPQRCHTDLGMGSVSGGYRGTPWSPVVVLLETLTLCWTGGRLRGFTAMWSLQSSLLQPQYPCQTPPLSHATSLKYPFLLKNCARLFKLID